MRLSALYQALLDLRQVASTNGGTMLHTFQYHVPAPVIFTLQTHDMGQRDQCIAVHTQETLTKLPLQLLQGFGNNKLCRGLQAVTYFCWANRQRTSATGMLSTPR